MMMEKLIDYAAKGLTGRKAKIAALAVATIVMNDKLKWGVSQQSIYCIVGLAAIVILSIAAEDFAKKIHD